ncbi:MAG: MEDS domain-containing protein [Solirubrobacteraceae bacterium]
MGIVPGDHVCASFGSDEEHQALVGRYARQALRRGERLLYLVHSSDGATIRRYLEQEGIDVEAGLALGQIEIRRVEHDRSAIEPEAMVAALQADRAAALRDGYSALCLTAEMSWAPTRPAEVDAVLRYEREVDCVFADSDIAGVCQYDRRLVDPAVLERLVAAHAFQICTGPELTTTARRRLTISEHGSGVVALAGALDIDAAAYLATRLAQVDGDEDLVLLTSGLGFADISGCRALVRAAEALERGRRMMLPEASPALVRVLRLCGWSEHGRLVLA